MKSNGGWHQIESNVVNCKISLVLAKQLKVGKKTQKDWKTLLELVATIDEMINKRIKTKGKRQLKWDNCQYKTKTTQNKKKGIKNSYGKHKRQISNCREMLTSWREEWKQANGS